MVDSVQYYVYILANERHTVLYIGMTSNIQQRMYQHSHGTFDGFTKKYNVHKLLYYEIHGDINETIKREKVLKKWKKDWKWALIDKYNPTRKNLYQNFDVEPLRFEE